MCSVNAKGVVERIINIRYYYYYIQETESEYDR